MKMYRTIPANTGRICIDVVGYRSHGDHPREYGENNLVTDPPYGIMGPSPRIRGESARARGLHTALGTIPANTGRIR